MKYSLTQLKIVICFCALSAMFVFAGTASAAEIFFGSNQKTVGVGQSFEVGVFVNTARENINTVSGTISFSSDNLAVSDIREGNSFITLWIEKPALSPSVNTTGKISFSGIVPGGSVSDQGYLFSVIFTPTKSGPVSVHTENVSILLNNGEGTSTHITKAPLSMNVVEALQGESYVPEKDTIQPEPFSPVISRDAAIFNNQFFIAFNTADKQSGIDHYEVKEGFWSRFVPRESPYVLADQSLSAYISVRAIDKSGNIREVHVPTGQKWYKNYGLFAILLVVIGLFILRIRTIKKNETIF